MNHLPFWEKKFNVLLPLCLCKSSSPYTLCPALTCPSQANSFYKTQLLQVLLCLRSLPRTPTRINCTLLQFGASQEALGAKNLPDNAGDPRDAGCNCITVVARIIFAVLSFHLDRGQAAAITECFAADAGHAAWNVDGD